MEAVLVGSWHIADAIAFFQQREVGKGLLRDHQAALCIAEAEGDLQVPFVSTADWGYLRLRRPDYGRAVDGNT